MSAARLSKQPPVVRQPIGEHEPETVAGLPGRLPPGETMLWQGAPRWRSLARAMHVRELAIYFLVLTAIRAMTAWDGDIRGDAMIVAQLLAVSAVALGMICLFAWLSARTTIYSVTDRRVVFRYGVALSKAVNIPFSMIAGVAMRPNADGTGELSLEIDRSERLPYMMMWPHVRPWKWWPAQPTLRCVPDAVAVAQCLSRALAAATGGQVEAVTALPDRERVRPAGGAVPA